MLDRDSKEDRKGKRQIRERIRWVSWRWEFTMHLDPIFSALTKDNRSKARGNQRRDRKDTNTRSRCVFWLALELILLPQPAFLPFISRNKKILLQVQTSGRWTMNLHPCWEKFPWGLGEIRDLGRRVDNMSEHFPKCQVRLGLMTKIIWEMRKKNLKVRGLEKLAALGTQEENQTPTLSSDVSVSSRENQEETERACWERNRKG